MFVDEDAGRIVRCSPCRELKPASAFSKRGSSGGRRDTYCRPCRAAYGREHYLANKQRYVDQARRRTEAVARERVKWLIDFFRENPCVDCGESDPVVLEFDHLRDKKFNISKALRDRSWKSILAEMAKCEVVCANCHRRRTARTRRHLRALLIDPEQPAT